MNNIMYDLADALTTELRTKDGVVTGKKSKRRITVANKHHVDYDVEVVGGVHDPARATVVLRVGNGLHMILAGFKDPNLDTALYFFVVSGTPADVELMHQDILAAETDTKLAEIWASDQCASVFKTKWHNKNQGWEKVK